MTDHTFSHQDHTLHYTLAGSPDNPPLIMIHGYLSSHHVWRTAIPALENDWYCVAIDLLGHGASSIDLQGDYSIAAQGQRVLALVDKLGIEHFTLLGHSMGGQIAMYIASTLAPARIEKLVNVGGVVTGQLSELVERVVTRPIKTLYRTPVAHFAEAFYRFTSPRFKWAAHRQFESWFYDFEGIDFDWWRIDRELTNQPGMRHTWYHGAKAIEALNLTDRLAQITAPTLIIFGAEDNVVPVSDGQLAHEHIPNSRLTLIEHCGHFPMYEKPEAFIEAVRNFLMN